MKRPPRVEMSVLYVSNSIFHNPCSLGRKLYRIREERRRNRTSVSCALAIFQAALSKVYNVSSVFISFCAFCVLFPLFMSSSVLFFHTVLLVSKKFIRTHRYYSRNAKFSPFALTAKHYPPNYTFRYRRTLQKEANMTLVS